MHSRAIIQTLWIACLTVGLTAGELFAEILGIHGRQVSAERGELVWFCAGVNQVELRQDDGVAEAPSLYVSMERLDNQIAARFDSLECPLFLVSLKAFIPSLDYFPDSAGDQLTPFFLSARADNQGVPEGRICGPLAAQATGAWENGGEWVGANCNLLLDDRASIWTAFEWGEAFPFAPVLGCDRSAPDYRTMKYTSSDGWSAWAGGDAMLRAVMLENDKSGELSVQPGASLPDSFRVYSAGQPNFTPGPDYYDTTVVGALHCRVKLRGPQNYFRVTAFGGGVESQPTEVAAIAGSGGRHADIRFLPKTLEVQGHPGSDTAVLLGIENRSAEWLHYRIGHVQVEGGLGLFSDPITIVLNPSSAEIAPGDSGATQITFSFEAQVQGQYAVRMEVSFWDSQLTYLDEEYTMLLQVQEPTVAGDDPATEPQAFALGQNFPNPFNARTVIPYSLGNASGPAWLEIYSSAGALVLRADLGTAAKGRYVWDGRDQCGSPVASGIYLCRLRATNQTTARKLVCIR